MPEIGVVARLLKKQPKVMILRSWYRAQKPLKHGNKKKSSFSFVPGLTQGEEFRNLFVLFLFFVLLCLRGFEALYQESGITNLKIIM